MHRSRLLIACISVYAAALPLVAVAATKITLTDIQMIMQKNTKPVSYNVVVEGSYDEFSATLSLDGTYNGKHDMKTTEAESDISLKLTADKTTSAQIDGSVRVKNKIGYVYLSNVKVTGDWAEMTEQVEPYMNKWISFPLEESRDKYLSDRKAPSGLMRQLNRFLDITTHEKDGKISHTITLPPAKQRQFLTLLARTSRGSVPEATEAIRSMLRTTKLNVDIAFTTLADKTFDNVDAHIGVKTSVFGKPAKADIKEKAWVLSPFVPVEVPAGSVPWEDLGNE